MSYVIIVVVLALLQFLWFGIAVGRARSRYNIPAPASSGNDLFDRHYRVQMNTLEQLILFLPALWLFGSLVDSRWAAGLGVVYLIGRFIYAASYVSDPKKRGLGFMLTSMPSLIMLVGVLIAAVRQLLAS
jgi:glutathione S-transferase